MAFIRYFLCCFNDFACQVLGIATVIYFTIRFILFSVVVDRLEDTQDDIDNGDNLGSEYKADVYDYIQDYRAAVWVMIVFDILVALAAFLLVLVAFMKRPHLRWVLILVVVTFIAACFEGTIISIYFLASVDNELGDSGYKDQWNKDDTEYYAVAVIDMLVRLFLLVPATLAAIAFYQEFWEGKYGYARRRHGYGREYGMDRDYFGYKPPPPAYMISPGYEYPGNRTYMRDESPPRYYGGRGGSLDRYPTRGPYGPDAFDTRRGDFYDRPIGVRSLDGIGRNGRYPGRF